MRRRNSPSALLVFFLALIVAQNCFASPPPQAKPTPAADPNEPCLACHSQTDLKSPAGQSVYVDPRKHKESVHGILSCTDCHTAIHDYPHPGRIQKVDCSTCHTQEAADLPKSIHGILGEAACSSCHGAPHQMGAAAKLAPGTCVTCHDAQVKDFESSVHGAALHKGDPFAANCSSCHGPIHKIVATTDPASPAYRKNLPLTCAACHSDKNFIASHKIPFAHPVEAYRLSVHGRAEAAGDTNAATCSDCHASHAIYNARDSRAMNNHWNVAATCGQCHAEIYKTYLSSIHGQAMQAGVRDAPVCTDCHGEHVILRPSEPGSLVNAARLSTVTCGRCHGDTRLAERYSLPADRLPSYADSYHGLAARSGSQTVANCASCHGVHNIFPSSDPRSTIHPANLSHTCGACHAGAGERFAIGQVHVLPQGASVNPVVRWIRWVYWLVIPATLGFMLLHNGLDFLRKLFRGPRRHDTEESVVRMNLNFRIAHWLVMLSFPVLVVTGFALKFPESFWVRPLLQWESRFALRGTVHRIAAVVLVSSLVYHLIHLAVVRRDRVILRLLIPRFRDATDFVGVFRYNLGLSKEPPRFREFSYAEKLEYWAFLWGTLIMTLSGFLLWFNNFTLRNFPKWVADAATAIHYYEAILATLSILVWHLYGVMFDPDVYPMELSWLNGKVNAGHYRETRPEYFAELERPQPGPTPPPEDTNSAAESPEKP